MQPLYKKEDAYGKAHDKSQAVSDGVNDFLVKGICVLTFHCCKYKQKVRLSIHIEAGPPVSPAIIDNRRKSFNVFIAIVPLYNIQKRLSSQ